jgi:DNA-3-methyladenine glycosylase
MHSSMGSMLPEQYYLSEDVVALARDLVGRVLVHSDNGLTLSAIIAETEAYMAPEDRASHAFNGRRTKRTEVFYFSGGRTYVYLCYGIHHMLNIITGPEEVPHAVLIRSVIPMNHLALYEQRLGKTGVTRLDGPGKLTKGMGIHTHHNNLLVYGKNPVIWISSHKAALPDQFPVSASRRIGIDYAGEWTQKPWRFSLNMAQQKTISEFSSLF